MLRIATYNVNSVRARAELLNLWLQRSAPDILCLQETKVVDRDFPHGLFEQFEYRCATHGQPGYNGVAICSRLGLEGVRPGIHDFEDEQARVLSASLGKLVLINTYVPHGDLPGTEKYAYKLEFLRALRGALERFSPTNDWILLLGDMNVARSDADVWDPAAVAGTIGVLPEERQAFEELLAWGFVDCYRKRHPDGKAFTWWDYRGGGVWKNWGMRIDYILATAPVAERCVEIDVDLWPRRRRKPTPSDHAPVVATFEIDLRELQA